MSNPRDALLMLNVTFFNNYSKKGPLNNAIICVFASLSLRMLMCVYQAIRSVLWQDVYPQIKLWEFYQVKVDSAVEKFRTLLQNGLSKT